MPGKTCIGIPDEASSCDFKCIFLKLDWNEPFCLGRAAHLQKACCTPTAGPQPRNSLLLALTSDTQSLIFGSERGLQESLSAGQWIGQWTGMECSDSQSPSTYYDLLKLTTLTGFRTVSLVCAP